MLDYKCRMCGEKLEKQNILNRYIGCGYCGTGYDIKRDADGEDIMVESEGGSTKLGYHASWTVDRDTDSFEQRMLFRLYYRWVIIAIILEALAFIGMGTFFLVFFYVSWQEISAPAIISITIGVLLCVIVSVHIKCVIAKSWKKRGGLKVNAVFKYDDFRMNGKHPDGRNECFAERYTKIRKAYETSDYIFLRFTIAKGLAVPLRAFGDKKKKAAEFLKEIFGDKYITLNVKKTNNKTPKNKPPTRGNKYNRKGR